MKFYYEGKLVRSSKTHEYSHGVLRDGKVVSCHGSYDLAVKEMSSRIGRANGRIEACRLALAAIERGDSFYWTKCAGRSYRAEIHSTKEQYLAMIEESEAYKRSFKVVELEAR